MSNTQAAARKLQMMGQDYAAQTAPMEQPPTDGSAMPQESGYVDPAQVEAQNIAQMEQDPYMDQMSGMPMGGMMQGPNTVIPGLTINNDQMSTMIKYGVLMSMMGGPM